jgi:hypothetical protein
MLCRFYRGRIAVDATHDDPHCWLIKLFFNETVTESKVTGINETGIWE